MGYTTDFVGGFKFSKPLSPAQVTFLKKFADTRRVKRDAGVATRLGDAARIDAGIMGVGADGGYFTGGLGFGGQDHDESVLNGNEPPEGQPGLWCHWEPSDDGAYLRWDGGEKFYYYAEWLRYIVEHFLTPWGVTVTGVVRWKGEDRGDRGSIVVTANAIDVKPNEIVRVTHAKPCRMESRL